jgi:hypothetical protein
MEFDNRWQINFANYKIVLKSLESVLQSNQISELPWKVDLLGFHLLISEELKEHIMRMGIRILK